jgi:hypothetical protein
VSEALSGFLVTEHGPDAVFLAGLMSIGAVAGDFNTDEGDGTAIASAICREWCERQFAGRAYSRPVISYAEKHMARYAATRRIIGGLADKEEGRSI